MGKKTKPEPIEAAVHPPKKPKPKPKPTKPFHDPERARARLQDAMQKMSPDVRDRFMCRMAAEAEADPANRMR